MIGDFVDFDVVGYCCFRFYTCLMKFSGCGGWYRCVGIR